MSFSAISPVKHSTISTLLMFSVGLSEYWIIRKDHGIVARWQNLRLQWALDDTQTCFLAKASLTAIVLWRGALLRNKCQIPGSWYSGLVLLILCYERCMIVKQYFPVTVSPSGTNSRWEFNTFLIILTNEPCLHSWFLRTHFFFEREPGDFRDALWYLV